MSLKKRIKEYCPDFLLPFLKAPYRIAAAPYREIRYRMISKRAMKYLPYYKDELSVAILKARLGYIKTCDKNIFLDLAERYNIKFNELTKTPDINFSRNENFSGIVIVYDNEGIDYVYMKRLLSSFAFSDNCRMMKLKDFLRGSEIKDDELLSCILTEYNRRKFDNYIRRNNLHYSFKAGPLYSTRTEEQYFDVFSPVDDEVVVDAGSYDGMTALRFLKWGGGKVKHVYSFELDPLNFPKCEANLKDAGDKVTLIKKGTWSENKMIHINATGSSGSLVSDDGKTAAELTAIDDVVGDEKVTFIKMDVEGAELESLKGAKNTIIKNHPRLAICAYHKAEDIYELPEYILSLVPEYKFYLRHYCSNEGETVLYAFVN